MVLPLLLPVINGVSARVPYFRDTFTGADGVGIASHTPDLGTGWTKNSNAGYIGGDWLIKSNRVYDSGGKAAFYCDAPAGANQRAEATIVQLSDDNVSSIGPAVRMVTNADTFYWIRYNNNGNLVQVYSWVAGTGTLVGSAVGYTPGVGVPFTLAVEAIGTLINGYLNGALVITGTDSAISAAGRPGIRGSGAVTTTTGLHFDDFAAYNL